MIRDNGNGRGENLVLPFFLPFFQHFSVAEPKSALWLRLPLPIIPETIIGSFERCGMNAFSVRPPVADLVFQVYERPLHPELFDILAVRKFQRQDYEVAVHITRSGHVITWQNPDLLVTEVADVEQSLANHRRLLSYRLRGEHSGTVCLGHGITYQMNFQVETLAPEIFLHVHDEILADAGKRGFLHNFQPNHRLAISPLGYVHLDGRHGCLFLSTFHTFPEECTVIKSQTLIEKKTS